MVIEIVALLAGFALVLVSYDRLAAMLLMVALRADATRVSTSASDAPQYQLGNLRHAVPSIAVGASAPGVARPGLNGLKLTERNEA